MQNNIIIIGVAIFFVIFVIYTAVVPEGSLFDRIGSRLAVLGVFIIAIGVYFTYQIFLHNINERVKDNTLRITEKGWVNNVKLINEYSERCPNLSASLFYEWQYSQVGKYNGYNPKNNNDNVYAATALCISLFQSWEDVLTLESSEETGLYVWMCNFIQWAHSPLLKKAWDVLKPNFAKLTIEFGDLLFAYTSKINPKNAAQLELAAVNLANSPELNAIVQKRRLLG